MQHKQKGEKLSKTEQTFRMLSAPRFAPMVDNLSSMCKVICALHNRSKEDSCEWMYLEEGQSLISVSYGTEGESYKLSFGMDVSPCSVGVNSVIYTNKLHTCSRELYSSNSKPVLAFKSSRTLNES